MTEEWIPKRILNWKVEGKEDEKTFDNVGWIWEKKHDGERVNGRGWNGQGPMEEETHYEVKGNHSIVKII